MTNNDRTATTITDEQARELYSLRLDKAWSWYELAQRYGIDERDARRAYDRIHAQRIAEANGTATTDGDGRIGLAREIVAFANDVDPYAITTNIDDLDRATADLARDLTQCVPWLEDQVTEYDDQEARELLARVRAALDEDLGEWMALAYDAGEQMGIETWANYRDAIGC